MMENLVAVAARVGEALRQKLAIIADLGSRNCGCGRPFSIFRRLPADLRRNPLAVARHRMAVTRTTMLIVVLRNVTATIPRWRLMSRVAALVCCHLPERALSTLQQQLPAANDPVFHWSTGEGSPSSTTADTVTVQMWRN